METDAEIKGIGRKVTNGPKVTGAPSPNRSSNLRHAPPHHQVVPIVSRCGASAVLGAGLYSHACSSILHPSCTEKHHPFVKRKTACKNFDFLIETV